MRSTAEDVNAISRKSQTRGDTGSNRDFRFLGRSLHDAGSLKILRDSSDPNNSSQHPKPFIRITIHGRRPHVLKVSVCKNDIIGKLSGTKFLYEPPNRKDRSASKPADLARLLPALVAN